VGYYAAGDQLGKGLMVSHQVARGTALDQAQGGATNQTPPHDSPRRRTRVINLTALSRAQRRIDRATRVAAKLFSMKKHGSHGLKLKSHRRRKKGI
jgi:hypothetical protein